MQERPAFIKPAVTEAKEEPAPQQDPTAELHAFERV
jgi:hypothetical protein